MSDSNDTSANTDGNPPRSALGSAELSALRREMVEQQLRKRGIRDERILAAMLVVPRHEFVPLELASDAYGDRPLPIGHAQTISQPFMVAAMAEALRLAGNERILEIGAGSGYQAAVLSLLAREICTVETQQDLAAEAAERLQRLGFSNVHVHTGDGTLGWPPNAPYDAIIVTAAAPEVPPPLMTQLAGGGRLVIPVGAQDEQQLLRIEKRGDHSITTPLYHCRFVPLIGQFGWNPENS